MTISWQQTARGQGQQTGLIALGQYGRSWTSGVSAGGTPALTDYFSVTKDWNTAALLYLRNDYYSVPTQRDLVPLLARWLKEGTPQDSTRQWAKLNRRIRGIST